MTITGSARSIAAVMLLTLAGCTHTVHQQPDPQPFPLPPDTSPQPSPRSTQHPKSPALPTPAPAATRMKAHPHFAPPPGVSSYWDTKLGVYVLDQIPGLYYRERTYYRWDNGWTWATYANGPWQKSDANGVPPGLKTLHP